MSRSGFYNLLGALARTAVALLTIPCLIRYAGLDEFGLWTLVSAIVGLFGIADSALTLTATIHISRDLASGGGAKLSRTVTVICAAALALAALLAAAAWLSAGGIAASFVNLAEARRMALGGALRTGAIWIAVRLLQQAALGVQQGARRYGLMNLLQTLQSAATNLGMIVIAQRGGGTVQFVQWQAAAGAGALIIHGISALVILRPHSIRPQWDRETAVPLAKFGGWTFLTTMGTVVFSQADRVVVGSILGTAAVGVYGAITAVAAQINSLSAMPVQPLLPHMGSFAGAGGPGIPAATIRRALHANCVVALSMGAVLFAYADRILALILPTSPPGEYTTAFQIAVVIYSFYSLNATGYLLSLGLNAVRPAAMIVLASAGAALALIALGAHCMGLVGAVAGNVGYQLAWLLTVLAMRYAAVPASTWLRWLASPVVWFSIAVLSTLYINNDLWRAPVLAVTMVGMFGLSDLRIALLNKIWRVKCILKRGDAEFVLADQSRFVYPADSIIGFSLFNGTFESDELNFFRERLKPGNIVLDIGANGGVYTIIAGRRVGGQGRVYAFEPDARNLELIKKNVEGNHLSNVTIVPKAVGNVDGPCQFAISRDGAMNSLRQNAHGGQLIEKWETVPMTTLDVALKELGVSHVDAIKIDVEGAERLVLEGARMTLANNPNALVLFEAADVASKEFGYRARDILQDLRKMGYDVHWFDGGLPTLIENADDPRFGRDIYNFVAVRTPLNQGSN